MDIISVVDPKWIDAAQTGIFLTVLFGGFKDAIPFVASPSDPEPHGIELYNRAIAGEFGVIALADPIIIPVVEVIPETFTKVFHTKLGEIKTAQSKAIAVLLGTHASNLSNIQAKIARVSVVAQEIRNNPVAYYGTSFGGAILPSTSAEVLDVVNKYLTSKVIESNAIDSIVIKYNALLNQLSATMTNEEVALIIV